MEDQGVIFVKGRGGKDWVKVKGGNPQVFQIV
jgi:hypothetical protein